MKYQQISLVAVLIILQKCEAFYKPKSFPNMPTYTPKDTEEVKKFLCMKFENTYCVDESPGKIIINKMFDFTASEGMKEEIGCFHNAQSDVCKKQGQLKLNVVNQCNGLVPTTVKYGAAGRTGIKVGSNKVIIGMNNGGIKGKGLRLEKSKNVEIRDLKITDINPHVIWGGDAIDMINVDNVLIDNCYIKNVGRQFIVTHFGQNKGITISNTVFDGSTPHSAYCNGQHYWLWLLLGTGDMMTFQNNIIKNTNGRGPHMVSAAGAKGIVHYIQNIFYDVTDTGLIDLGDKQTSILLEGNVFVNVSAVVQGNLGNIYLVKTSKDEEDCKKFIDRPCLRNVIVKTGKTDIKNSEVVLQDFSKLKKELVQPINMRDKITKQLQLPAQVMQNIPGGKPAPTGKPAPKKQPANRGKPAANKPKPPAARKPAPKKPAARKPGPKPHNQPHKGSHSNKGGHSKPNNGGQPHKGGQPKKKQ